MKRDQRHQLLALSTTELKTKQTELTKEVLKARQEMTSSQRAQTNVKKAYQLRKQIKMIKAEMTKRELTGQEGTQE